ncbi:4Fe-4S dicluster domain-containing protein, partial [Candidatus Hodarchaeum mangrovi]
MINSEKSKVSIDLNSEEFSIINTCYQCGYCTSVCPLRKVSKYNPRLIIHSALLGNELTIEDLTTCLTCSLCFEGCPQEINFPDFIRESRAKIIIAEENF